MKNRVLKLLSQCIVVYVKTFSKRLFNKSMSFLQTRINRAKFFLEKFTFWLCRYIHFLFTIGTSFIYFISKEMIEAAGIPESIHGSR
jgi:hypothetical protein